MILFLVREDTFSSAISPSSMSTSISTEKRSMSDEIAGCSSNVESSHSSTELKTPEVDKFAKRRRTNEANIMVATDAIAKASEKVSCFLEKNRKQDVAIFLL